MKIVVNPEYHHPNGVSLLAAEDHVDGPFFLQMSDHLFGDAVLARLGAGWSPDGGRARLLVDRKPLYSDDEDATKVRLSGEMIVEIGKELPTWDAVDTGCFLLDERIFSALRKEERAYERSVTVGMRHLIAGGLLEAVELEKTAWVDVDTPLDHSEAERLFGDKGPYVP